MDIKLKHRLVGACVILALAVFFLPMILDSEKYSQEIKSQIPEKSVLQGQTDAGQGLDSAENSGSLTINLDEDEPEKAIKTQPDKKTALAQQKSEENSPSESSSDKPSPASTEKVSEEEPQKTAESNNKPVVEATPHKKEPKETQAEQKAVVTKNADDTASKDKTEKAPPKKEETPDKPQFEQTAWVIQIGSFSNKENATSLVSELRNKGYRAYLRDAGKYSRVYVGPYPDESAAKKRTESLEKVVGASVQVLQFDPQGH